MNELLGCYTLPLVARRENGSICIFIIVRQSDTELCYRGKVTPVIQNVPDTVSEMSEIVQICKLFICDETAFHDI